MHVALVSPAWPLRQYPNGIVTYVHWMREELRRQGHRVSIFTRALGEPESDVHAVRLAPRQRVRRWLRTRLGPAVDPVLQGGEEYAQAVLAVHRASPIDVVEMEESFGWAADVAAITSIPTVVKLHGPAFLSLVEEELDTPLARAKIRIEGEALRRVHAVTSPAACTLEATLERYRLQPAYSRHIVNPLSLPGGAPLWDLAACDRRTLLFVGRFDKRKGGDIVLEAFARLLPSYPDLKLIFVGPDAGVRRGEGEVIHFEQLRAQFLPGATATQVDFRGRLAPHEIYALRPRALVTLIASRWENQSYTALEAMLQGCPVVSSDIGGQREIIEDGVTGLLAAPGSAEDLARKVRTLLDDPHAAAAMGRRARLYAIQHHAPAKVVAETLEAYDAAIRVSRQRAVA
jgi:glycosyltransferase involved in cell wall biosynthesis